MTKQVFQSKWGFHPVSYETSKKLRFINKVFSKAQHVAGAWERWERKEPQNRVIYTYLKGENNKKIKKVLCDEQGQPKIWEEPNVFNWFYEKIQTERNRYYTNRGRCQSLNLGELILEASRIARTPASSPEAVQDLKFSEKEIDEIYQAAKSWMESGEVKSPIPEVRLFGTY